MKTTLLKAVAALAFFAGSLKIANAQAEGLLMSPATDTVCAGEQITITNEELILWDYNCWYEIDSVNWQWSGLCESPQRYGIGGNAYSNSPETFTIPNLPPGYYYIVMWTIWEEDDDCVDDEQNAWTANFYVGPSGGTATIAAAGPTTFCGNDSVTLYSSGTTGTYQWFFNDDTIQNATADSLVAAEAGNYTLQTTNTCGTTLSGATMVTVDSIPTATVTANGPVIFCHGDSVVLSTTTANAYQWSNNATTQSITVTQSGSYSVSIDNGGNCSAVAGATVVTVHPAPDAAITPSDSTAFCAGDSEVLTAGAESSYMWSNGATTQGITVDQAGSFTVNVTDTLGCTAQSTATTVTVNQPPAASITANSNTTFCQGDSVILSANTESSYLWSTDATIQSITVKQAGSYTVKVTDVNGCTALSGAQATSVNSLPIATVTPGGPATFCSGDSVTLAANNENSYLWSNGVTTQNITVTQAGSYSVMVGDANNCSGTSASITITVDTLPAAVITASGDTVFCAGSSVNLNVGDATLYQWSDNATSQSIDVTQSGAYSVTLTNGNNCSASSNVITVTVNALPDITITPAQVSFCTGGNATLTVSGGISYAWSNGGNNDATIVTPDTTTIYTVTVTGANGCIDSAGRTVTVNPLPSAAIIPSGSVAVCQGDSTELSAAFGSANYLWTTQATTQNIKVGLPGNYSVTVTSVNNCTAVSAPVSVTVSPLPAIPTISRAGDTLTSSLATSYQWYLNDSAVLNASSRSIVVTQNGNYAVQISDTNGCQNTSAETNITTLGIMDITANYSVQLYPNPNNGSFVLQFSDNTPRSVSITDVTGRLIVTAQQVAARKDFDCTYLPAGIYLLQIKDESSVQTLRVVMDR
jgi:large repetitive protein